MTFLFAGAVVNVAVAWGCALILDRATFQEEVPRRTGGFHRSDRGWWSVRQLSNAGSTRVDAVLPQPLRRTPSAKYLFQPPSWVNLDDISADNMPDFPEGDFRLLEAHGWPLRALWCDYGLERADIISVRGGIALVGFETPQRYSRVSALPLRPIWPGLAVNTLFYAVILWVLIPGPFVLRRFLRRRRGLCPACAYRMGESATCTECGKDLPKSAVA